MVSTCGFTCEPESCLLPLPPAARIGIGCHSPKAEPGTAAGRAFAVVAAAVEDRTIAVDVDVES